MDPLVFNRQAFQLLSGEFLIEDLVASITGYAREAIKLDLKIKYVAIVFGGLHDLLNPYLGRPIWYDDEPGSAELDMFEYFTKRGLVYFQYDDKINPPHTEESRDLSAALMNRLDIIVFRCADLDDALVIHKLIHQFETMDKNGPRNTDIVQTPVGRRVLVIKY